MNTRNHRSVHLDTNKSKGTACSKTWYGWKWTWDTIDHYTYKQIRTEEQVVARNDMDVNETKTLSNITPRHKFK